jgi:hypothetical protein
MIIRDFRKSPNAWQDKNVLRTIRENCKSLSSALSLYLTLTELASNSENDEIEVYGIKLVEMS